MLVNTLTRRVNDLQTRAVTRQLLLGYLLTLVFWSYEVLRWVVESTLTRTLYFLFHVILFIKCGYAGWGGEMLEKVRCSLMSAFWKVKIDSTLKINPREQTVSISSEFLPISILFWFGEELASLMFIFVSEQEAQLVASHGYAWRWFNMLRWQVTQLVRKHHHQERKSYIFSKHLFVVAIPYGLKEQWDWLTLEISGILRSRCGQSWNFIVYVSNCICFFFHLCGTSMGTRKWLKFWLLIRTKQKRTSSKLKFREKLNPIMEYSFIFKEC